MNKIMGNCKALVWFVEDSVYVARFYYSKGYVIIFRNNKIIMRRVGMSKKELQELELHILKHGLKKVS